MKKMSVLAVYIPLWALSLIITANCETLDTGSLFFLVMAGFSAIYLLKNTNAQFLNTLLETQKNRKGYRIAKWVITLIFSFQLFGRSLFMQGARLSFSLIGIVEFAVLCISLCPLTIGILNILEKFVENKGRDQKTSSKRIINAGLICATIGFIIDFLFTLSYYPCTMTNDSFGHWQQATGVLAMSDYSPMAFNLLLKGLFSITGFTTPYVFVLFQTIVLSIVVGDIAAFLSRRGAKLRNLIIGSIIFAVLPSTYMLLLYLSKNPLAGILCLGMVSSLLQVIVEPERSLYSLVWYIKTVLLISGVYLVRENNVVIFIPLIVFVIWFVIANKKHSKRILIAAGSVAFVIILMTQVVYKMIEYEHADKSHETVRPLLAPIGCAIQQDLDLPDDIREAAERVLPAEEWKNRYEPFNSDPITWGTPKPQYKDISLKEAFIAYLKMLAAYPDVVIRDRLDGMNVVWDIRAPILEDNKCPKGVYGDVTFKDTSLPAGFIADTMSTIKNFASSWQQISSNEQILDIFIWKNGIYIYLLMVTALFLFQKKKTRLLWAVLPSCFILLTYVLVIAWQMYFYLWFFPLSVVMLMIVSIVECGKNEIVKA